MQSNMQSRVGVDQYHTKLSRRPSLQKKVCIGNALQVQGRIILPVYTKYSVITKLVELFFLFTF